MSTRQVIADRWEIAGVLGQGGMGDVYRGYDLDSGDEIAIKLLKPDIVDAMPDLVDRFKREARLLHQLNHPNIVRIFDTVEEDDLHYLIMEYVPGGSLRDLLDAESVLPIQRIVEIALDLSDALTRAHRLHIVHRDLKPANVLLAADGTPRLTDFGIARVTDSTSSHTQTGSLVGTVGYVSPEACRGQELDSRSDIWSFGVILCEMLTGHNPYVREQVAATITAILNAPIPDLEAERDDAPLALIDLIYRMLEKNPADRISSMRLVGAELEAILQGGAYSGRESDAAETGPTVHVEITTHEDSTDSAAQPPIPRPVRSSFKHALHSHQTPFVGREHDLEQIDRLMTDPTINLVTLAAPGGMGKTRIALEYATRKVGQYPSGVYFVPLVGVTRREDIVLAIADAIRFGFAIMGEREDQLLDFLKQSGEQHMLLVLDNLEHILDDAVPLISVILRHAPEIHILTTTRVRLNLASEIVYEIGGMHIPDDLAPEQQRDHEAVQLFANSAQRSLPGFRLRDADLPDVMRICKSVYGNPLGIVLAGAWAGMLSPKEIADEVAISLDFLQTDAHDIPERQRSLRAVFDSSVNMLTDTERDAFMKLSIFRGGVKRTVAQYITGASLNTLAALVKKSLIRRDPDSGRYEVHELLRQYAAEALDSSGGTERTRDIHSYYFMSLAAQQIDNLRGADQANAIRALDADYENIRFAWEWAVQRRNTGWLALGLDGIFLFCAMTGEYDAMAEMMHLAQTRITPPAGTAPDTDEARLWRRIAIRGQLARTPHSDPMAIEDLLELARDADDPAEEAFCLWTLGYALCATERYTDAVKTFFTSLATYQQIDDPFFTGRVMSDVGVFSAVIDDHEQSMGSLMQSGMLQQSIGDAVGLAQSQMRMILNWDYLPPEIQAMMLGQG